jgi:hypothetical protein
LDSMRSRSIFVSKSLCLDGSVSRESVRRDDGLRMMFASLENREGGLDLLSTP